MPRRPSRRFSDSSVDDTAVTTVTTRSRRASDMDIDGISDNQEPIHPMRASLDCGDLQVRNADRKFTDFLDLKRRYHSVFLENLRSHVHGNPNLGNGYDADALLADEDLRWDCAIQFLNKYGMFYWGTEENRKKYLAPARLEKLDELAIYPEREDEIAQAITILLEKKMKRDWKFPEKNTSATEPIDVEEQPKRSLRTPTPPDLEPGIIYTPGSKAHDTPGSAQKKKKKKLRLSEHGTLHSGMESPSSHRTPKDRSNTSILAIREGTPTVASGAEIANQKKRKRRSTDSCKMSKGGIAKDHHSGVVVSGTPETDPSGETNKGSIAKDRHPWFVVTGVPKDPSGEVNKGRITKGGFIESSTPETNPPGEVDVNNGRIAKGRFVADSTPKTNPLASLEKKYEHKTKFLVVSTTPTQEGMAPIWVPYQHLESASDFLNLMVDECRDQDLDPSLQLSYEFNTEDPRQRLLVLGVRAASITFEWAKFEIRVRPGVDRDWAIVLEALQKAWAAKDDDDSLEPEEFRIGVILHVA